MTDLVGWQPEGSGSRTGDGASEGREAAAKHGYLVLAVCRTGAALLDEKSDSYGSTVTSDLAGLPRSPRNDHAAPAAADVTPEIASERNSIRRLS